MRKILLIAALTILTMAAASAQTSQTKEGKPVSAAHRGCHFKSLIPENSLAGVRMAKRFGYRYLECDVKYTKDSVLVLMHDKTINRTMRNASDYSVIDKPVAVNKTSFNELRRGYVFESEDPQYRTYLPTLKEELEACKECGIIPILHSSIPESYRLAQEILGDDWVCFNSNFEVISAVRGFSECMVLWDPKNYDGDDLQCMLQKIGRPCGISTMKTDKFGEDEIGALRKAGYQFQSSIWKTPFEMRAVHDGASIILSDWYWTPSTGIETAKSTDRKSASLSKGDHILIDFPQDEFSAMTLEIKFKGSVEIVLNGEKRYPLVHSTMETQYIGLRMHEVKPSIEIIALDKTTVKGYKANYFKL